MLVREDALQARVAELEGRVAELEGEREDLRRQLEERKLIERAKGIIMEARGWTEQDAYGWLRRQSQEKNIRIADLARKILLVQPLLQEGAERPAQALAATGR